MSPSVITKQQKRAGRIHPLVKKTERLRIWKKAKGIWKNRQPDPIKELRTLRDEWR